MRTKACFTTLFLALAFFAFAQPAIEWQRTFGGSYFDEPHCIRQTSDGGYIVAGTSASHNGDVFGSHGNYDVWVIKLHSNGSLQWKKAYGGTANDETFSIEETNDGGYIIAGYSNSNNFDASGFHGGEYDGWVLKLNSAGVIQWQKMYGGSSWDDFWDVAQTTDGGYILTGLSASIDGDVTGNKGSLDTWVVKINASGEIEWQRNYGGSGEDHGYSVAQTTDGGYIIVSETASDDGDVTGLNGNVDVWVLKLSATGEIEWQRALGGENGEIGTNVLVSSDGGYVITAYVGSHNSGDISGPPYLGILDFWVAKLNVSGELQWQIALGGSEADYAREAVEAPDGSFVVIGSARSIDGDLEGNTNKNQIFLVKISATGQLIWKKSLGGTSSDDGFSLDNTNDGGYILAGFAWSTDGDVIGSNNIGYNDYWIVKLAHDVSSPTTEPLTDAMQIFPNPTAEAVQLKVPMDVSTMQVSITDIQGREVLKAEIANGGTINVKSLPSGMYQVAAKASEQTVYFAKLEIRK